METHYTVRQTVEMTGVKSYVLRYWEEELELQIHRNELGHRYYTGYDIQLFMNIKELKRRGLQLRAIKKLIPQITASMSGFEESGAALLEGIAEDISEDTQESTEEDINTEQSADAVKAEIHNNEKILELAKKEFALPTMKCRRGDLYLYRKMGERMYRLAFFQESGSSVEQIMDYYIITNINLQTGEEHLVDCKICINGLSNNTTLKKKFEKKLKNTLKNFNNQSM